MVATGARTQGHCGEEQEIISKEVNHFSIKDSAETSTFLFFRQRPNQLNSETQRLTHRKLGQVVGEYITCCHQLTVTLIQMHDIQGKDISQRKIFPFTVVFSNFHLPHSCFYLSQMKTIFWKSIVKSRRSKHTLC